jgi:DNA primase
VRFDDRFIEELKTRLRPSEVIGRSVKLKRQGREWVGLSPFNKERTPSFYVNDEKAFWHDFSSGKSGDVIGFLQETERLSFPEAVERLAEEAGLPLPTVDPRAAEQLRRQQSLSDWLELAAAWYEAELRRPAGQGARAYLTGRGLPAEAWGRFRLGYAPAGRTALKDYLVAKGATPGELVDAGLLIAPEGGGAPYDRFRDRVMFPITDGRGRLVSFGGRALDPEARAKYLNGPETGLFHKGAQLYGLAEARRLLNRPPSQGGEADAPLVVVEGYFDAIACWRAEVAAVAPLGTALTEEQMALLWKHHGEPTLCFDGDAAGLRAAHKAIDRALPLLQPGRSFRFALLGGGQDPDDILRTAGAAALRNQLAAAQPFAEALFARERDAEPLDTPERRAGLKVRLRKLAASIADPDLATAYRQTLLDAYERLWTLDRPAYTRADAGRALQQFRGPRGAPRRPAPAGPATQEGRAAAAALSRTHPPFAAALVEGLLRRPDLLDTQLDVITVQGFGDPALDDLVHEVVAYRFSTEELDPAALRERLERNGRGDLLRQVGHAAVLSGAPFLDAARDEDEQAQLWSRAFTALRHLAALERAFEAAKADFANDPDTLAFRRLKAERDAYRREIKTGAVFETH